MELSIIGILTYTWIFVSTKADEYGSFHNSSPPFHYYRNRFTCVHEHKRMLWDSLTVEVHPGRSHGCGISLLNSEVPELWSSIDLCLNGDDTSGEDCTFDGQLQTAMYRVNETRLLNNNITFPCVHDDERPEILAIHLIYTCSGHLIHEEYEEGDVMTLPPPPPPPRPVPTMLVEPTPEILTQAPPPPPGHQPTMMVEPTDYYHTPEVTHNIVTHGHVETSSAESPTTEPTTESVRNHYDRMGPRKGSIQSDTAAVKNHPITAGELATIVGPSVAAIAVLIIILIIIIVIIKRKTLKLPTDLQGESLFHSRRFSTASQLSDISLNNHQMRSVP